MRDLYRACHPTWPELPGPHFYAWPTLVAIAPYPHNLVGYSSYGLNVDDNGRLAIWLKDTGVAPEVRGQGIARELMMERLRIGREMGAGVALGMTQPENKPMLALLHSLNFEERLRIKNAYPAGETGIFFGLGLAV